MKTRVQSKLNSIIGYPLFQRVGNPLPPTVMSVENWQAAMNARTARKWENCSLMARNVLQRLTEVRAWQRSEEWNPLAEELRPLVISFVDAFLPKVSLPANFAQKVKHRLCWDIMGICFETEYEDVLEPFFNVPYLDPWYACGHFPCGWDGDEFPEGWDGVIRNGRLIVF